MMKHDLYSIQVYTQYKRQNKINISTETSSRVIDRSSSGWKAYIDLQENISEMIKHQNMKCYERRLKIHAVGLKKNQTYQESRMTEE